MSHGGKLRSSLGFTLVELSAVIFIISILATIVIFSIGSWREKVATSEVLSDLNGVKAAMENARNFGDAYPSTLPSGFSKSKNVDVTLYASSPTYYCVDASSKVKTSIKYFIDVDVNGKVREPMRGGCATGEAIAGGAVAGWSDISLSSGNVCGVIDSRAYCDGVNTYGEVGDNTTTDRNSLTPVNVTGVLSGKKVTDIAVGLDHGCALSEGKVYCWGRNTYGELGNGNNTNSLYPVAVSATGVLAGKTVTAISAGGHHTCAIATSLIYCWGLNASGQLGDSTTTHSNIPVAVIASGALSGKTITAVSGGDLHTCAIGSGAAYCWGSNSGGQVGDDTVVQKTAPTAVTATGVLSGKNIDTISAGGAHTCAAATGLAYCWGDNTYGQLGDNTVVQKLVPTAVHTASGLSGKTVTKIDTNLYHTCALASGVAYCWGRNHYGQMGDNTVVQKSVPTEVYAGGALSGKAMTDIKVGALTSCAITTTNAYCWGYGGYGQLNNGGTANSSVPVVSTNP
ncbi:MAG: regulator of chromosome condensation [Candidatus Saccharibacteria bacterium]|jgi:prepilin-type N-terminal cleavage/methylation domain-containing protein|nr:regulator of chromosome condensation [Candidatus Saccharibacteria bacterium]